MELALTKPTPDLWDKVLTAFRRTLAKSEAAYLTKAKSEPLYPPQPNEILTPSGFNCTDEENTHSLATLRRRAWQALRTKVDEQTADAAIISKLRAHFEERFRYDEGGIPRVWRPDDDIDGTFKVAKDNASIFHDGYPLTKTKLTESLLGRPLS